MTSYPAGISMSNHALITVSDALRVRGAPSGSAVLVDALVCGVLDLSGTGMAARPCGRAATPVVTPAAAATPSR